MKLDSLLKLIPNFQNIHVRYFYHNFYSGICNYTAFNVLYKYLDCEVTGVYGDSVKRSMIIDIKPKQNQLKFLR